ncbi:MAG: hypothetical protein NT114_03010 [Patescibacteria group bacterium]|nr:hypothetical protein [Patescibacteria group bacterium]
MTKPSPQKHVNVDGILYDVSSGRELDKNHVPEVLDLRNNSNLSIQSASSATPGSPRKFTASRSSTAPQQPQPKSATRPHLDKPSKSTHQAKSSDKQNSDSPNDAKKISFFSFVIARGILPRGSLKLWQASLFRTIASPQTWLLLSLPLILVQFRVIQNLNLNQFLVKAKDTVTPENFKAVTVSLGVIMGLFLLGVIVRSIITSAGVHVRLREIDNRPAKLSLGIHSAMHSLLRQMLNYIVHFAIIVLWSGLLIWLTAMVLTTGNSLVSTNKYQIAAVVGFAWLFVMALLYTKHWLQIGLLSRSSKVARVQLQSISLLFSSPLKNAIAGLVGFSLSASVILLILAMSWFVTDYFIAQQGSPVIAILVVIAITTVVLLTNLTYVQQNLWARHYYFVASLSKNRNQLLYMEREKPASSWPLYVAVLLAGVFVGSYFLLINLYGSRIRGEMANIHAMIPEEIKLVVPLK